jgi:hypothetical protein
MQCQGTICSYLAFDFSNISWVCKGKGETLCCVQEQCFDFGEPSLGFGVVTNSENKEFCKIALPFCALGLKSPEYCLRSTSRLLCCKAATSLPFDKDYVEGFVCAAYGVQCAPECSCCGSAGTHSPALNRPLKTYAPSQAVMARVEMVSAKDPTDDGLDEMPKYSDVV